MMGALVDDPGWLRSVAGAEGEDLEEDAAKLSAHRRVDRMILTRFVLVMYHFEQALYADPDSGDLNSVWWDLVERFLFVDRPPGQGRARLGGRHPRRRRPRLLPQLPDWGVDLCPAQELPGVPHNARPLLRERGRRPLPPRILLRSWRPRELARYRPARHRRAAESRILREVPRLEQAMDPIPLQAFSRSARQHFSC